MFINKELCYFLTLRELPLPAKTSQHNHFTWWQTVKVSISNIFSKFERFTSVILEIIDVFVCDRSRGLTELFSGSVFTVHFVHDRIDPSED